MRGLIEYVLEAIGLGGDDAIDLVWRTGVAESKYMFLSQIGGPAVGFWQMEPETAEDIVKNYIKFRPGLAEAMEKFGYMGYITKEILWWNLALQIIFCRLKYRRDKHPLPKAGDILAQAKYWKRIYNTSKGKGTVEHFLEVNNA